MTDSPANLRLAADYPVGAFRAPLRRGTLIRLRRGAYLPADATPEIEEQLRARCIAVARQLRTRYAFSHDTAVLLHELPTFEVRADVVHVVQPVRRSGSKSADVIRHFAKDLPPSDIAWLNGLPVTTLERTCLDSSRSQHPAHALAVADAVLRTITGFTRFDSHLAGTATEGTVDEVRDRLARRVDEFSPGRGVVRARTVIAHADPRSESPPESWVRWLMLTHGFAAPDLQVPVNTDQGTFYPDLLWSGTAVRSGWRAVGLEYDGVDKYRKPEDIYNEKLREDALRAAGCYIIRATKADLRDSRRLIETVSQHVVRDPDAADERRGLLARS